MGIDASFLRAPVRLSGVRINQDLDMHDTVTPAILHQIKTRYIDASHAPPPEVDFLGVPLVILVGQSVQFTDQSLNDPISWSWDFGDGETSTAQNPLHTYTDAGLRDVTLIATNAYGDGHRTKVGYVLVQATPPPVADFDAAPLSGDAPLPVHFTDLSLWLPTSWSWDFGDGGHSTDQFPDHTYTTPGTYTVALTATNSAGSDTKTVIHMITVTAPLEVDVIIDGCTPGQGAWTTHICTDIPGCLGSASISYGGEGMADPGDCPGGVSPINISVSFRKYVQFFEVVDFTGASKVQFWYHATGYGICQIILTSGANEHSWADNPIMDDNWHLFEGDFSAFGFGANTTVTIGAFADGQGTEFNYHTLSITIGQVESV